MCNKAGADFSSIRACSACQQTEAYNGVFNVYGHDTVSCMQCSAPNTACPYWCCLPSLQVFAVERSGKAQPNAFDKHLRHVIMIQRNRKHKQQQADADAQEQQQKQQQLADFSKHLRATILSNADVAGTWQPAMHATQIASQQQAAAEATQAAISSILQPWDATCMRFTSTSANSGYCRGQLDADCSGETTAEQ
jgi:hypothetical protein